MSRIDAESTVEANMEFEIIFDSYGVRVPHYHSDNGMFDTNSFKE